MTSLDRADSMTRTEVATLLDAKTAIENANAQLTDRIDELQHQLNWFKRQLFGEKSERRLQLDASRQLALGEDLSRSESESPAETQVEGHRRRQRISGPDDDKKLRFDPSVPVEDRHLKCKAAEKLDPSEYTVVGEKVSSRLLQKPASYRVVRYHRPVIKRKSDGSFLNTPPPLEVLENSMVDVSVLACTFIDKYLYHRVPRRRTLVERQEVRHAARKMRVGPSGSGCRSGFQTASSCAGQEPGW